MFNRLVRSAVSALLMSAVVCSVAIAAPAATPAPAVKAPAVAVPAAKPAAAPVAAVYPGKIDAKYASLKPADGRRKTCLDQYKANKATNGNGGQSWIQAGGGYYSACNKKLKG